jgi:hypothetical protein
VMPAALERLEAFYQSTGRRVSLLGAVTDFVESATKLGGRALAEAVDGFLRNVVSVKSKTRQRRLVEMCPTLSASGLLPSAHLRRDPSVSCTGHLATKLSEGV